MRQSEPAASISSVPSFERIETLVPIAKAAGIPGIGGASLPAGRRCAGAGCSILGRRLALRRGSRSGPRRCRRWLGLLFRLRLHAPGRRCSSNRGCRRGGRSSSRPQRLDRDHRRRPRGSRRWQRLLARRKCSRSGATGRRRDVRRRSVCGRASSRARCKRTRSYDTGRCDTGRCNTGGCNRRGFRRWSVHPRRRDRQWRGFRLRRRLLRRHAHPEHASHHDDRKRDRAPGSAQACLAAAWRQLGEGTAGGSGGRQRKIHGRAIARLPPE